MSRAARFTTPLVVVVGLLIVENARGAVLTVGPGGAHATVQAALDAAFATAGNDEIRVHTGTYREILTIHLPAGSSDEIDLSGGWNDDFSLATNNPAATVFDGESLGRVVHVIGNGGALRLRRLTLRRGDAGDGDGGGLAAVLSASRLSVENCHLRNNRALTGGGALVDLRGPSEFRLVNSLLVANRAVTENPAGGGLYLYAEDDSRVTITGTKINQNLARSDSNQRIGGGFMIFLVETAQGTFTDNEVSGNSLEGAGVGIGAAGALWLSGSATAEFRRSRFLGNGDRHGNNFTNFTEALSLRSSDNARLRFTDSLVAKAEVDRGLGVTGEASQNGRLWITNVTVVDAGNTGLRVRENHSAAVTVFNSVVFGHTTNLEATANVARGNNLIGTDPKFVDRAGENYRLKAGSPAANKGRNNPQGGLGPLDLDRKPRIKGARVDIGAYESL